MLGATARSERKATHSYLLSSGLYRRLWTCTRSTMQRITPHSWWARA